MIKSNCRILRKEILGQSDTWEVEICSSVLKKILGNSNQKRKEVFKIEQIQGKKILLWSAMLRPRQWMFWEHSWGMCSRSKALPDIRCVGTNEGCHGSKGWIPLGTWKERRTWKRETPGYWMSLETRLTLTTALLRSWQPSHHWKTADCCVCAQVLFLPRVAGLQASCLWPPILGWGQSQCQGSDCQLAETWILGTAVVILF